MVAQLVLVQLVWVRIPTGLPFFLHLPHPQSYQYRFPAIPCRPARCILYNRETPPSERICNIHPGIFYAVQSGSDIPVSYGYHLLILDKTDLLPDLRSPRTMSVPAVQQRSYQNFSVFLCFFTLFSLKNEILCCILLVK